VPKKSSVTLIAFEYYSNYSATNKYKEKEIFFIYLDVVLGGVVSFLSTLLSLLFYFFNFAFPLLEIFQLVFFNFNSYIWLFNFNFFFNFSIRQSI
jgi:hypothetical protein